MTVTSGYSQYLEDASLNWFRGTTYPAVPAHVFLALFTTAPINGVDSGATEVAAANNYARVQITPNTTNFGAPSGAAPASIVSGADFVFGTPSGSWGTIVGWALYDALTSGNMLVYGTTASTAVGLGDTVEFLSGNMTVTAQ